MYNCAHTACIAQLYTPLHAACTRGQVDVVRALIDHGAELQHATAHGNNALHIACLNGQDMALAELIAQGPASRGLGPGTPNLLELSRRGTMFLFPAHFSTNQSINWSQISKTLQKSHKESLAEVRAKRYCNYSELRPMLANKKVLSFSRICLEAMNITQYDN